MAVVSDAVVILLLTVLTVIVIVSDHRFAFEQRLRGRYGIDRDWWAPPIALAVTYVTAVVGADAAWVGFIENIDIIVLIFSFGVMAEGLGASGFFKYISYKIVDKCQRSSFRLVLYMFTMTSIVTLFSTNDIVILVITPIIIEICFQTGIKNAKPLLLSQFVAANTLSMGLLIGSPTNIIISEEVGLDFISYFLLMIGPALMAFAASFVLVYALLRITRTDPPDLFADLAIQPSYEMPARNPEPYFTKQMRDWVAIFGILVVLVTIVTMLEASLLWCAVPSILIGLGYWVRSEEHSQSIREPIRRLPYGVFFFGITFFIFAEAFARTAFFGTTLIPFLDGLLGGDPVVTAGLGVGGAGLLVNVFNDLPAAAIVAQILSELSFDSFVTEILFIQGLLAGINIGTYLTQIGALAGILWFNTMRVQREKYRVEQPELAAEMSFPSRLDLVRYGAFHFVFAGTVLVLFLLFKWLVISVLIGPFGV